jgi:hypothetical protein
VARVLHIYQVEVVGAALSPEAEDSSLCGYDFVAHADTPKAMRSAKTGKIAFIAEDLGLNATNLFLHYH